MSPIVVVLVLLLVIGGGGWGYGYWSGQPGAPGSGPGYGNGFWIVHLLLVVALVVFLLRYLGVHV